MITEKELELIKTAKEVSQHSPDLHTKNGAVITSIDGIVLASGCNEFPTNVDNSPARLERPDKYLYLEHAERNALFNAFNKGQQVKGCTMYVTLFPCSDCARAIIQTGIKKLVTTKPNLDDAKWGEQFKASLNMLTEANVSIIFYDKSEQI